MIVFAAFFPVFLNSLIALRIAQELQDSRDDSRNGARR